MVLEEKRVEQKPISFEDRRRHIPFADYPGLRFCKIARGTKKPFEREWVKKPYTWTEIQDHISKNKNYGVLCGYGDLIIIDSDTPELRDAVDAGLPKSLRVRTGSGGTHDYYICKDVKKKIVLTTDQHYGEVQAMGAQCVGPGSLHPNGGIYEVIRDGAIVEISLQDLTATIKPFMKEIIEEEDRVLKELKSYGDSDINSIPIMTVMNTAGFKLIRSEYAGANPWHGSEGGMNTWINPSKNVAKCWRCDCGINVAKAIALNEGIINSCGDVLDKNDFLKVLEIARRKYGLKRFDKEAIGIEGLSKKDIKLKYLELTGGKNRDFSDASELLVKYIKNKNYIYAIRDDEKSEIWMYSDGIYKPNGKSIIGEQIRDVLEECYTPFIFNLVIAKLIADTAIGAQEFFNNNYVNEIPVQNGILDVMTHELRPFDPKKIFFTKLPVNYDPLAQCPMIDKFHKDVLPNEEDAKIIEEIAGFALRKEYTFEKAIIFLGFGRNGKSKELELLKRFVGVENCSSQPLASLIPGDQSIHYLHGKLLNLSGDISSSDLKDTSIIKALTGRDRITSQRKYKNNLDFENYAKLCFACNQLPMVYDLSKGFWDRWVIIDYPFTFVPKWEHDIAQNNPLIKLRDEDIISKIVTPEELSGFLNKALLGLQRLIDNKGFSSTRSSDEVKATWIRKSNSFVAFCMDRVKDDYQGRILRKEFRKEYNKYCNDHKLIPKSDAVIKKTMIETFGASEERHQHYNTVGVAGQPFSSAGEQEWFWVGVSWK